MKKVNFRYDINGLRAIAVLVVVIFHFLPTYLTGGFVGVDVFFVISGFLMTSIIFNGLANNKFNLFKFYVSRANRIIPALGMLCLILVILGWFFLPPTEYKSLGKHIVGSITFLSNIFYWQESGYFDASSHEKWLLHTWSLSVEWQFYIIYPVILLILNKFINISKIKLLITLSFIFLFLLNIYLSIYYPTAAYFLLPSRVWEMLLGGVAFLYPIPLKKNLPQILSITGTFLILIACIFISSNNSWPGYFAIIPTLGAYFILIANNQESFIARSPIFQKIGLWSYSIYLWHWPLVVIGYYYNIENWFMYGLPLSVFLGFFSYKLVESKNFVMFDTWKNIFRIKPVWFSIIIALIGFSIFSTKGFQAHYPNQVIISSSEVYNKNPYTCLANEQEKISGIPNCYIGNKNNLKLIIVGDSHADAVVTALTSKYNLKNEGILVMTRASCPLILNAKNNKLDDTCYKENFKRVITLKEHKNTPIIIISRWSAYINGQSDPKRVTNNDNRPLMYFDENKYMAKSDLLNYFSNNLINTLCEISDNSKVYITQPIPEMGRDIPKTMSRLQLINQKEIDLSLPSTKYYEDNIEIRRIINNAAKQCGVTVLDPAEILCKNSKCIAQYNNRPIYQDGDHLSEYGNKLLIPLFRGII
ncbi:MULTISPECIES: acyltransferase family protein [Acinetobacter]|nr:MULTISPECIES: acyltransferase family protein [Acinetobacter]MCS4300059.1 peptidoglycan/LPS O-acetylase OafA/YrhL [Acinetobacter guillouiae]MCW2253459.1 peptidoglycan/LPS O-acetylase OafA/YrhL [Acinetobacter sp. BIGb0204]NII37747.1 peptidoglycan/LPS O-acetylase OafA/YrhL [Acinetobacter sp. BIGb0196]